MSFTGDLSLPIHSKIGLVQQGERLSTNRVTLHSMPLIMAHAQVPISHLCNVSAHDGVLELELILSDLGEILSVCCPEAITLFAEAMIDGDTPAPERSCLSYRNNKTSWMKRSALSKI